MWITASVLCSMTWSCIAFDCNCEVILFIIWRQLMCSEAAAFHNEERTELTKMPYFRSCSARTYQGTDASCHTAQFSTQKACARRAGAVVVTVKPNIFYSMSHRGLLFVVVCGSFISPLEHVAVNLDTLVERIHCLLKIQSVN